MISRSGLVPIVLTARFSRCTSPRDVGDGAVLLVRGRGGKHDVGALRGLGQEHVLHHDEARSPTRALRSSADSRRPPTARRDPAPPASRAASCRVAAAVAGTRSGSRPMSKRRASSNSPPGRCTSPECRASRRMRPACGRASPLIVSPNRITSSGSAVSLSRSDSTPSSSSPGATRTLRPRTCPRAPACRHRVDVRLMMPVVGANLDRRAADAAARDRRRDQQRPCALYRSAIVASASVLARSAHRAAWPRRRCGDDRYCCVPSTCARELLQVVSSLRWWCGSSR